MERFNSFLLRAVAVIIPLLFVGCVPYQTYERLKKEHTQLKGAHDDLVVKYNRAIQDIMRLKGGEISIEALQAKCANLEKNNKDLTAQIEQLSQGRQFPRTLADRLPPGVEVDPRGDISMSDQVLFNSGQEKLKDSNARKVLDSVANILKADYPNEILHISGHTDTDPIKVSPWKTNQRLGYERAYTVFSYFRDMGIPEDQMILHSFSFTDPVDSGTTKEAKAKNRRVVISLRGTKI